MTSGPCLSVAEQQGRHTASGATALAGWAGFSVWTEWLAAALLYFFLKF
jgi:hypothetical protein